MLIDETILGRLRTLGASVAKPGEDVVAELVGLYRRDSGAQLERLKSRADVDTRGIAALADTAHALKGASLAVGASKVADLAKELEVAARDEREPQCAALIAELEAALVQTWEALGALERVPESQ